jgi:hypothetical protein
MRQFIFAVAAMLIFSGCATVSSVPVPPERNVASNEHLDLAYNRYFKNQNFYMRLVRLEMLTQQLQDVMPEKGHAKKALVQQFESDLHAAVMALAADGTAVSSKFKSWIPSAQESGFNEKVRVLGKVLQSSKVMDRMGIYLTSSGVFDEDSFGQAFYFDLIGRALAEIDTELRNLVLVYPPEMKDADENQAKLSYAKGLAIRVRSNLRKVMPAVNSANFKRVDSYMKRLSSIGQLNPSEAQRIVDSADFKFVQGVLSQVQPTTSGDIQGFEDQVDSTVATKFGFEMISQLLSTVR